MYMKICSSCSQTSYSSCSEYEWFCPCCKKNITLSKGNYVKSSYQNASKTNKYKKITINVTKSVLDSTI